MGRLVNFCAAPIVEDLPGAQVDNILLNVLDNGGTNQRIKKTERLLQTARTRVVMLDSSGFRLLQAEIESQKKAEEAKKPVPRIFHDASKPMKNSKMEVNLAPHHVIKAAKEIKPDLMVALDFPIQKIKDPGEREKEFKKKMVLNVRWAKDTAKLREKECRDIALFIPVQCYTLDHFEHFIKRIRKEKVKFHGLSMPIRNLSLPEIALFLVRFYQIGVRYVHLLGVSAFFPLALASYMASHFFDWVSLDATTWKLKAKHSEYMNPHDLVPTDLGKDVIMEEDIKTDCPCPWCKGRTFTYLKHLPYTDKRIFLGCHNYWVIQNAAESLFRNSNNPSDLKSFLERKSRNQRKIDQLYRTLCMIEVFKDRDIRYLRDILVGNTI